MRDLPLVPYESLIKLINGNFTSKQMNYFIHLCKMCDKNGIIEEKNISSILETALNKDAYLLSRASGYRAMAHFINNNILFYNSHNNLEIRNYKESFYKGSKGLVVIPMFCFSMKFKSLSKLQKRIAVYLIAQIRNITSERFYTFNIKKVCKKLHIKIDAFLSALSALECYFDTAFFHKETVCRISYKKSYLKTLIDESTLRPSL